MNVRCLDVLVSMLIIFYETYVAGEKNEKKFAVFILTEYIRSLTENKITIEHFLYELLINCLVINKMYYQLHQMIQYHILIDSKPLVILSIVLF